MTVSQTQERIYTTGDRKYLLFLAATLFQFVRDLSFMIDWSLSMIENRFPWGHIYVGGARRNSGFINISASQWNHVKATIAGLPDDIVTPEHES